MNDVVIVPTHGRPEMLLHCLEHLEACPDLANADVRIVVDQHQHKRIPAAVHHETLDVIAGFTHRGWKLTVRDRHFYWGNSFNVLTAYKESFAAGHPLTFLVEDDVMVEPGFFAWHRAVHESEQLFCSIASANTRSGQLRTKDDFASLGVCFPLASLGLIVPHARVAYFINMGKYCVDTFGGDSKLFCEQDGLILRIMKQAGGTARYPETPLARHVGDYGYNRGLANQPGGDLQARYRAIGERIRDKTFRVI